MADPQGSAIFLWRTPVAAGTSQERRAADLAGLAGMPPLATDAEVEIVEALRGHASPAAMSSSTRRSRHAGGVQHHGFTRREHGTFT